MAVQEVDCASRSPRSQTVFWVLAVLLALIAGGLWRQNPWPASSTAFAQSPQPLAGARGVYAFTGPLDATHTGVFMLDIEQGTLWCYEIETVAGTRKLKLITARTWLYDRYLRDFNCSAPDFRMVQELVAQQRAQPGAATQEDEPKPRSDAAGKP